MDSDSDSDSEIDITKDAIEDLLSDSYGFQPFAYAGNLTACSHPGLSINEIGNVGLPLSDHDAKAIFSHAQQSAFGHKEATVVDVTVRRSWELNPSQFSLRNPSWLIELQKILSTVHEGLRLKCRAESVSLELYKLLLYEPGAFFKPHKDSEKVPGMFGTLIVCLPTAHEGGKLVLKHNGEIFEHQTQTMSDYNYSFAAWYSNITHEVEPVTSGYRLVLTYNLVRRTANVPIRLPSSNTTTLDKRLQKELIEYSNLLSKNSTGVPYFLVYKLDHQYTQISLRADRLDASDHDKTQALQKAASASGFEIYLATLEKTATGDEDLDQEEYHEDQSQAIINIVDLDGNKICDRMGVSDDQVLGKPRERSDYDESEHEGYTGNEGAPITYWYRDTVVVIMPKCNRIDFQYYGARKETNVIELLRHLKTKAANDVDAAADFVRLCKLSVSKPDLESMSNYWSMTRTLRNHGREKNSQLIVEVLRALLELDQYENFSSTIQNVNAAELFECAQQLGLAIMRAGFRRMKPSLDAIMQITKSSISKQDKFLDNIELSLQESANVQKSDTIREFKDWRLKTASQMVQLQHWRKVEDGKIVANLYMSLLGNDHLRDDSSLKGIREKITSSAFAVRVGFFNTYAESKGKLQPHQHLEYLEKGICDLWTNFAFSKMSGIPKSSTPPKKYSSFYRQATNQTEPEHHIECNDLVRLVENSLEVNKNLTVADICNTLQSASKRATGDKQVDVMVLFTRQILGYEVPAFLKNGKPIHVCQTLIQTILAKYITEIVGLEPNKPQDFVRHPQSCYLNCMDCQTINSFLVDPTTASFDFHGDLRRRKHLNEIFDSGRETHKSYSVEIIKKKSPHTWRITKNHNAYAQSMRRWNQHVSTVQQTLKSLEKSKVPLRGCLGSYEESIMSGHAEQVQSLLYGPLSETQPKFLTISSHSQGSKRAHDGDDINGVENKKPRLRADISMINLIDLT